MQIGIIDYGMGNLLSVKNALQAVGAEVRLATRGEDLSDVHGIVLPGVGSFGSGMQGLRERGFVDALEREVRERRKPMLGICLGMQLLADRGNEGGEHRGLCWIDGTVARLDVGSGLRVPHIGWNDVQGRGALFAGIPDRASFYFVHSFHLVPASQGAVYGTTEYGVEFVSAIEHENIYGVQFHPEKSHKHGLALLKNFVSLVGRS
jgi:imidazole glycerol phosphate synthase glutamine amidotransferase subunit